MRRLAIAGALLVAVALLALGCGKSEKTVYNGPGGKVSVQSGKGQDKTVNVETKEGTATVTSGEDKTITEAELGAPVYPGARVQAAGKFDSKKAGEQSVEQHILFTNDSFEKVAAFYKSHLKNTKGEQNMSQGEQKMAIFTVGEGKSQMMVHVSWDAKEKRTMIQVMKQGM